VHGAAAVVFALDVDEVPVDLRAVAILGLLVALAGGEVEGAVDLFVEKDVAHRLEDVRIEGDGELADVARAGIAIEDGVELLGVVGGAVDDFAVFEFEPHVVEGDALIDGGRVEADVGLARSSSPAR